MQLGGWPGAPMPGHLDKPHAANLTHELKEVMAYGVGKVMAIFDN